MRIFALYWPCLLAEAIGHVDAEALGGLREDDGRAAARARNAHTAPATQSRNVMRGEREANGGLALHAAAHACASAAVMDATARSGKLKATARGKQTCVGPSGKPQNWLANLRGRAALGEPLFSGRMCMPERKGGLSR